MPTPKAKPKAKPRARKATPKRVASAVAENTPAPRIVKYRGLEISVPPSSEWGSEMYYLVGEWQDGDQSPRLTTRMLSEMIGDEQLALVRRKHAEDGVKFVEMELATVELFNAIFAEFGTSTGESEASPVS